MGLRKYYAGTARCAWIGHQATLHNRHFHQKRAHFQIIMHACATPQPRHPANRLRLMPWSTAIAQTLGVSCNLDSGLSAVCFLPQDIKRLFASWLSVARTTSQTANVLRVSALLVRKHNSTPDRTVDLNLWRRICRNMQRLSHTSHYVQRLDRDISSDEAFLYR